MLSTKLKVGRSDQVRVPARFQTHNTARTLPGSSVGASNPDAGIADDDKPATAKKYGFYLHVFVSPVGWATLLACITSGTVGGIF